MLKIIFKIYKKYYFNIFLIKNNLKNNNYYNNDHLIIYKLQALTLSINGFVIHIIEDSTPAKKGTGKYFSFMNAI
jgi:hypothetical protein